MLKSIIVGVICGLVFYQAQAQNLYIPRDVQGAFNKGTRSMDGKPGKNYWQNHARYNISITALPPDRNIKGIEQIVYFNNSPDTLKRLNMKLILNIHRPGAARFFGANPDYLTPGIQVDSIFINGTKKPWDNARASRTNQMVGLPKPLAPHDSVKLNITWHFEISKESGREGMIDSTSYYLAYYYPRVSVYDDYNGWDTLEFLDAQEFYNDFNDYTLNVTVPKNYLVWATGTLQNANKVLQPEYAKRLEQSFTSDSTIHIATKDDLAKKNITAQNDVNTWTWTATNISDMAVGVSDHYDWDAASVGVDDKTHRRASMQAAFLDSAADFHHSVQAGRNSLGWLSHNWPGVPYPFPKMTAFQGFADMEYPMMVNDSHQDDIHFAAFVQDHEIAHTWFPFYMGINESRYSFMDEGWATTFELLIGTAEVGKEKAEALYKPFRVEGWINDPSQAEDLPIIVPTSEERGGFGNNAYGKPSLSYFALKDMLGDDLFKKALHTYMDNWHGKHPIPWDYFNSMNSGSGKNLNWFFNNWFFTNYYIDLNLQKVTKVGNGYALAIQNIGGFANPFDVKVTYADGSTENFHQTPAVWEKDQKQITVNIKTVKEVKSAVLDGGIFMDADTTNNKWEAK
ncbi:M1 family metallopeptidase [Mucilaginibacter sp.]|uniref:M1 family metallopeptidase n=1 Tax=Mucilaginibacter sp. TaxID=1882438 RepID=UPI0025D04544|nr:M1 family metallopeptidase [Mucilaginibacter sp.]